MECGTCIEVCNISDIDTGKPETVSPHDPVHLEADAVILGAGAAGTIVAVKLAELTGKKIIVLENPKCEVYKADKSGVIPGFYAAGTTPPVCRPMQAFPAIIGLRPLRISSGQQTADIWRRKTVPSI